MATDAEPQPDGQLHTPADPETAADGAQKPPVKRSWRRKYRKMRAKFEDAMTASNTLIMDEWKAQALARRLQEQNDQILEILLSMNATAGMPAALRFDLRDLSEIDAANASLSTEPDPEIVQHKLNELKVHLTNNVITAEDYARRADQLHNSLPVKAARSLAALEAKVPHTTEVPDPPVDGIDISEDAPGFMSSLHEEEYLLALDLALADPSFNPDAHDGRPMRILPSQPGPTEKDLTVRNPSSVYNWLRKNQPQVFLQDKDPQHPENMSEKSTARPANAGSRNKRQSAAVGTPGPKTDHEDEDSAFVPETGTSTAVGKGRKSKGGEDDSAYRPKGGSSRPAKRKREDGDVAPKASRKKNRASAGNAS